MSAINREIKKKKNKIKSTNWIVFEGYDEDEKIKEILNNSSTKFGDIIEFMGNNQLNYRKAKIIKDSNGNKKLGKWKFLN